MGTKSLRIAVADDEADMRDYFAKILPTLGHEVVVAARNGREFVEKTLIAMPDLLISDIRMPDMDGIDAVCEIYEQRPTPSILISAYADEDLVRRASDDHVMAYLIKPVKQTDLKPAIDIAMRRFGQMQSLRREANDLRRALAERKIIERAKGLLMKQRQMDEREALRTLQNLASSTNRRLADVAAAVLEAEAPESRGNPS